MNAAERQRPPAGELYLDHLAHFVPDLGAAAAVWEALGFAVTGVSVHNVSGKPAGTSNRCVMLEEGYVELLAPTLDTPNAQRVHEHMKRFVGVHLACFGTPDAAAEHRRLADHGFEPEPPVSLERNVEDGGLARFNVIYVAPGK
ncbi:MAG: VOC family protein, partial [Burkholderiales bacterium]